MQKLKYIIEILLVILMSIVCILELINQGFSHNLISQILIILILTSTFYENYAQEKTIQKLLKRIKSKQ